MTKVLGEGAGKQEKAPKNEQAQQALLQVTRDTALSVARAMLDLDRSLSEDAKIENLDNVAGDHMGSALRKQSQRIGVQIVSVGSEGEKDRAKGLEIGTVLGEFGDRTDRRIWIVNDPIEGTKSASRGIQGATSILAASQEGGLIPTPKGAHYMDKIIAPAGLRGKLSLEDPVGNLEAVSNHFGVEPSRIVPVILNRSRNNALIEKAREFGAKPELIEWGDLLPALAAVVNPQSPDWDPNKDDILLVMGVGGWEEGVIAAAAAKVMGGEAIGQMSTKDGENSGGVLGLDQLVPGSVESTFVAFTPITYEQWFGIPGAQIAGENGGAYPSLITKNGRTRPSLNIRSLDQI